MAFAVFAILGANYLLVSASGGVYANETESHNLGGPTPEATIENQAASLFGVVTSPSEKKGILEGSIDKTIVFTESGSAVGDSKPFEGSLPEREDLKVYTVQEGDSLSQIASQFGISIETIKLANPDIVSSLSSGQELTILPVTGMLYETEEGDTVENVSSYYRIDPELVKRYNPDYQKLFDSADQTVVLPFAVPHNKWTYMENRKESLPSLDDFFEVPAKGHNWNKLHYNNGVDIANSCGTPIKASAEGLVVEAIGNDFWNEGYGNYIIIEHPNGTQTKYAHTLKNFVSKGDYILQGEEIALIGNTGNTHGPTGCHLHFEVHGAENPFAS